MKWEVCFCVHEMKWGVLFVKKSGPYPHKMKRNWIKLCFFYFTLYLFGGRRCVRTQRTSLPTGMNAIEMCNISHHTLKYVAALTWEVKSSNLLQRRRKCKQNASIFTYCRLIYYFNFWLLLNILWKSILFYAKRFNVNSGCTLAMQNTYYFRLRNISSTGPDLWPSSSPDLTMVYCKIWAAIQHRLCRLTLTDWSSASWILITA